MAFKKKWLLTVGIAMVSVASFAQFEGGPTKPWEDFKLSSKNKVKLEFRGANIDLVISYFQKVSGITIVKDPTLVGPITITSAKPVTLNEAFQIFSQTLSLKKFDLSKEDNLLVIKAKQQDGGGFGRGGGGFDPSMFQGMGQTDISLKVYPIVFANASRPARNARATRSRRRP